MSVVTTRKEGDVLLIVSDNPPVNALGQAVRQGLADGVAQAAADADIRAVVLICAGRTFFAGADITEFGKPPQPPGLNEVIDALEASAKPVVAAIHGTALGGGLEVALGCHYRIAARSAKLGLPEVKLGLLPGAGGTQRLPRLIGAEAALGMIVSGDPVPAMIAGTMGLVDRLAAFDDLEKEAVAFAREIAGRDSHPRVSEKTDRVEVDRKDADLFERFRKTHARRFRGFEAPEACLKAVQAAVEHPFADGMKVERAAFLQLVGGDQSRALRHVFFAQRQAAKIDGIGREVAPRAIARVGIIGAGTMGGGIAMNFLTAGLPVTMIEREQEPLDRGVGMMRKNYERSAKRGRFTADQVEAAMGRLTPSLDLADLADCDLIIEAVFENMDIKKEVFAKLDAIAKPGAILASNTSYLDVDEIASVTKRPEDVLGLHFFSPANVMKLLEVVRGEKTVPDVMKTAMETAKRIGKIAVVSGVCHGFIGNRMLSRRQDVARDLILSGPKPWDVDAALTGFGFPMGPFQMSDLAGLDIGWSELTSKGETIRDVLCEMGRRGQKTQAGYYDYGEDRRPKPSAKVEEVIAGFAEKAGRPQLELASEEIRDRLLFPMIDEGARILAGGVAQRASDIDTVWINGYGWPAWTGGPMHWAATIGIDKVVEGLEAQGQAPSPALRDFAAKGGWG
jgi:3-hydroxyacyl-CoA dehydrogenase